MAKRNFIKNKNANDENFPVGSIFLPKSFRKIVKNYYNLARKADDVADNAILREPEKLQKLAEIEQDFLYCNKENPAAAKLREDFATEGLDTSVVTDLFVAFRQDAQDKKYQIWEELLYYCNYSAAPVGRFMLALFDESPTTYLPSNSLCAALQIVNHVQDVQHDAKILNRCYIPQDLLDKYNVKKEDFLRHSENKYIKDLKNDVLDRVQNLINDASILPSIIANFRLKVEVCIIFSLTNIMIKKIRSGDVLAKKIKLSKLNWAEAIFMGVSKAAFTRRKTLTAVRM